MNNLSLEEQFRIASFKKEAENMSKEQLLASLCNFIDFHFQSVHTFKQIMKGNYQDQLNTINNNDQFN
jgi:hypothetical protein